MEEKILALADLFQQAGDAHHEAFLATDGADPEWPLWYADYLHDKLPAHLNAQLTKSQLVYLLVDLESEQKLKAPGAAWARYYARTLLGRYG